MKSRGLARQLAPIGPRAGSLEFLAVILAHEAPARTLEHLHPVDEAPRDDRDLQRLDVDDAEFGAEPQAALLRHDHHLAVSAVEIGVTHRFGDEIGVAGHPDLGADVARRGHRAHAGKPCERLLRHRQRIPAILTEAGHVRHDVGRGLPVGQLDAPVAGGVLHRRADAVGPRPLWRMGRERRARKLLAIEPVGAFLRRVPPLRQGAGQGLGLEVVAEAGHVARDRADGVGRPDHALGKVACRHD